MADKKISALTAATTPLAGTEVLPIVQSGSTVKVSVANLTAGRAIATAGGSFTDNFTQSTAAKGFNLTANTPAAGMSSQLLNWYEEGTWTPIDSSGAGLTFTTAKGTYTRIGRMVFAGFEVQYPVTVDVSTAKIGGLPFSAASAGNASFSNFTGFVSYTSTGNVSMCGASPGNTFMQLFSPTGVQNTNNLVSGAYLRGSAQYFA